MAKLDHEVPAEMLAHSAARYAGCSRALIYAEALRKRLRTRVVGSRVFFDRSSLDELKTRLAARRERRLSADPGSGK